MGEYLNLDFDQAVMGCDGYQCQREERRAAGLLLEFLLRSNVMNGSCCNLHAR